MIIWKISPEHLQWLYSCNEGRPAKDTGEGRMKNQLGLDMIDLMEADAKAQAEKANSKSGKKAKAKAKPKLKEVK